MSFYDARLIYYVVITSVPPPTSCFFSILVTGTTISPRTQKNLKTRKTRNLKCLFRVSPCSPHPLRDCRAVENASPDLGICSLLLISAAFTPWATAVPASRLLTWALPVCPFNFDCSPCQNADLIAIHPTTPTPHPLWKE